MKKKLFVLHFLLLISYCSFSQSVGIGTTKPDTSAALDISNTTKGLLIPRMNTPAILSIINPAKGLMVYDSLTNQLMVNISTPATPNWQSIAAVDSTGNAWSLNGNKGTNPSTQFIGTTDKQPLLFRVNNIQAGEIHPVRGNIFWGLRAGNGNTTGFSNIAIGTNALKLNKAGTNLVAIGDSALFNNSPANTFFGDGISNTAIGSKSLFSNTAGNGNTATGFNSLLSNTQGSDNTATGFRALFANTTGIDNAAFGFQSLSSNTTGRNNTAVGSFSLFINATGNNNTATGDGSLFTNTTGFNNTATGFQALNLNTTGFNNSALGTQALLSITTGALNTGVGAGALISNTIGSSNTALGFNALRSSLIGNENTAIGRDAGFGAIGNFNVAVGFQALSINSTADLNTAVGYKAGGKFSLGNFNVFIGANADASQDDIFNSVAIGNEAKCTGDNQVRLGNTGTASIGGSVGYTTFSDGRYKKNIQEGVKGIDFIMKLRPVTYQLDVSGISQKLHENNGEKLDNRSKQAIAEKEKTIFSGFVAQEVEKAAKDAGYDFSGVDKPKNENDLYGLRYSEFVVPLVKAMQEQQQTIVELKKQVADLQNRMLASEKK